VSHAYKREQGVAEAASRAAGALIRSHAGGLAAAEVSEKSEHDVVTFVDHASETLIRSHIQRAFPGDAVLGEEGADAPADAPGDGRLWVVDPLDGTTNFAHGIPPYSVAVALYDAGRPVMGVVYDVAHDELFSAVRGGGFTMDGRPAHVSATDDVRNALIGTGFPYRDYRYMGGYMETFQTVARAARGVRRHGSAAVDLAWVACGRFDGFFEAGLSPWDIAAGALLVEEAGGHVDGLPAGADAVWGGAIVASNGRIHDALTEATQPLGEAWATRESGGTSSR
jgi:myo-inositol-1(or 4)-monophosphatase